MSSWWVHDYWNADPSWVNAVFGAAASGPALLVSWVVWVIGSIILHELAHGWTAIRLGDRTPIENGHMTWNPLVHMGGFSLVAFAIMGIAWGAMPIDPSRIRGRHGDALVALAGPAMNVLLALAALICGLLWIGLCGGHWTGYHAPEPLYSNVELFFRLGALLNLILMAFNLVPIPPLDGWRVLGSFWPAYDRLFASENGRWIGLGLFILLFFMGFGVIVGVVASINAMVWVVFEGILGLA